jgi:hypothetical protein
MITRKYLVGSSVAALTAVSLALGVGLAVGSDTAPDSGQRHTDRRVTNQEVHPATAAVTAAFSAFSHPSADSVTTAAEQAELRNELGAASGTDYGAIGNADFSMAKAAPISGSLEPAYLVPSGDQVCIVLPDPGSGFGATCQTLSAIKAGKGVLTLTPQPGSTETTALVGVIVPDGGGAPSLETSKGSASLRASGNVAASIASTKDTITTAAGNLSLAAD